MTIHECMSLLPDVSIGSYLLYKIIIVYAIIEQVLNIYGSMQTPKVLKYLLNFR